MKIIYTCIFCLFCFTKIFSQQQIIIGKVINEQNENIDNASICQFDVFECNYTDSYGVFHLVINDINKNKTFSVSSPGYITLTINKADTIRNSITLVLEIDPYYKSPDFQYRTKAIKPEGNNFVFISNLYADIIKPDFSEFKAELGNKNINFMNNSGSSLNFGFTGMIKKYYAGFSVGILYMTDNKNDSLEVEFNTTHYKLNFGYNLINSKRIWFSPEIALRLYKYRLLNSEKDAISLSQYIIDKELDIRIKQLIAYLGLNFSYKIYNQFIFPSNYWTIGVYGGYVFKINDSPWISSKGNSLISDKKINLSNFNFGISIAFHAF